MIDPIKSTAKDVASAVICWVLLIGLLLSEIIFKRK